MPKVTRQTPPTQRQPPPSNGRAAPARTAEPEPDPWGLSEALRVVLYGKSGTGKTTLASTFPSPLLWLICSGGQHPGELKSIDTPENRKRITPVILKHPDQLHDEVAARGNDVATVVLDHATGYSDMRLATIMGLDPTRPIAKYRVAGKGESWSNVGQQQYGQLAIELKEDLRALVNLPSHVVLIAHERTFNDNDEAARKGIPPSIGAALTPSVVGWLNGAFDHVLQTFLRPKMVRKVNRVNGQDVVTEARGRGMEYCVLCEPHDLYLTKFRVPKGRPLPDVIVDPSYEKILKVIKGE